MSLIECKKLCVGYDNKAVSENISFKVNAGDYLCILGRNGAGKSTLIKTLLGILPPISGDIIFGDDLKKSKVGYLPQGSDIQKDFPASVNEIVLSGFQGKSRFMPFYSREEKNKALENMKRLGIDDLAGKSFNELSGGQRQRVLISRALCAADKLLLLDEPMAGLDEGSADALYDAIKELNEQGTAIIMITHDKAAALKYADGIFDIEERTFYKNERNI